MTRVNLAVPYSQKDAVKAMGARWDQELRTWWATTDQCRAHPGLFKWAGEPSKATQQPARKPQAKSHHGSKPIRTEQRLFSLPGCICRHVAPWDHCEHTDPHGGEPDLDEWQRSNMESITGRITL
jgi:hypothetical protein